MTQANGNYAPSTDQSFYEEGKLDHNALSCTIADAKVRWDPSPHAVIASRVLSLSGGTASSTFRHARRQSGWAISPDHGVSGQVANVKERSRSPATIRQRVKIRRALLGASIARPAVDT